MSLLTMRGVAKSYGEGDRRTEVLQGINIDVEEGEFVAIVGFSGSGKTTLVSLIAGLISADCGAIRFDGKDVKGAAPERAVIFQNYSLLPWMTVFGNILLAVEAVFPTWSKQKQADHARHYIEMVNLTPAMGKRPHELSGGMRQRVSVARALAMNPRMLLLDEPLGALDALTRGTLQQEIQRIVAGDGKTAILITNDVDEAILLADRIFPLKPGPRATLGPAVEVDFPRPRNVTDLNADAEFKRIRNELTQYLTDCRDEARAKEAERAAVKGSTSVALPDLAPIDLTL